MSLPQINPVTRDQALTDLIEAIALQEAAWASMIAAEAAKVDALVGAGIPAAVKVDDVNAYQGAVANVVQIAANRAQGVSNTLELVKSILAQKADAAQP